MSDAAWRKLQGAALSLYRTSLVQRFLQTALGQVVFETAYLSYKEFFEARGIEALRRHVGRNDWIVDIGANIGFFTNKFASWLTGSGKVIAIEPEATNFSRLIRRLAKGGLTSRVIAINVAATDKDGPISLAINPVHPGDHRISQSGDVKVDGWRVDKIVEDQGSPKIGLIKIDVQGAEMLVLSGSIATVRRCKPAIFIELDDGALRQLGSSVTEILRWLDAEGYEFAQVSKFGKTTILSKSQLDMLARDSAGTYFDILALPQ